MTESDGDLLFEFTDGPNDVMTYRFKAKNGKVILDINDGDLGRITMENLRAVEELNEGLERVEEFFKEQKRHNEEL